MLHTEISGHPRSASPRARIPRPQTAPRRHRRRRRRLESSSARTRVASVSFTSFPWRRHARDVDGDGDARGVRGGRCG